MAQALGLDTDGVAGSYRRLADRHVIVVHPASGEVWMAMPFSAVSTEFRVVVRDRAVWANCAWDAFWHRDRLSAAWQPRDRDASSALLTAVGLSGPH